MPGRSSPPVVISFFAGKTPTAQFLPAPASNIVVLSPMVLPGVNYTQAYPGITLYATGGTPPYTWSVVSGSMPSGLSLASNGVLTGGTLDSGAATYNFTVQAEDAHGSTVTQACSVTVTDETLYTTGANGTPNPSGYSDYYGSNQSTFADTGGGLCNIAQDIEEAGWTEGGSDQVLVSQEMSVYDPGNWWVTAQETGPQQSPANTGTVYTGPESYQYFYTETIGTDDAPLSNFTSLTTSYSCISPPYNGIDWPDEGAQVWEFCYDIWLNGFGTEVMIWNAIYGPRYPAAGYPTADSVPIALTNPVNITAGGLDVPFGQLISINCGPGGTAVQFAFSYRYAASESAQNQSTQVPWGPFTFVQVASTSAYHNTLSGTYNLIGGGNGIFDWLVNEGYVGGTAGAPGQVDYTPTLTGVNYGVEICSTGGTDYPALTYQVTSFTLDADPVWTGP